MKSLIRTLIIALFLFISGRSFAQDTLGVGIQGFQTISSLDSTNFFLATDTVTVAIKNKGANPFTGTITVNMAVDTGTGVNIFATDTFGGTMAAGDSILKPLIINYNPTNFKTGTNIVVIWPSAAGAVTLDSAFGNVQILGTLGIAKLPEEYQLQLFPNPSNGAFTLLLKNPGELFIRRSMVVNMEGKELYLSNSKNPEFDLSLQPDGHYIVRIEYSDGRIEHHKLLKAQH